MSDDNPETIALPVLPAAESIPAMLAAPRPKRARARPAAPAIMPAAREPEAEPMAAPAPPAADPAEPQNEDIIMATTIEHAAAATTDKAQATFNDMNGRATDAMAKGAKALEEMNVFAKGNVEALVESGKIAAKGVEAMAQDAAGTARKHFEDTTAMVRTLATVKSPTEFMKLQSDFARAQFDQLVAETSRSTETMLKLVGEVVQPMANRFAVAVEKMKVAA